MWPWQQMGCAVSGAGFLANLHLICHHFVADPLALCITEGRGSCQGGHQPLKRLCLARTASFITGQTVQGSPLCPAALYANVCLWDLLLTIPEDVGVVLALACSSMSNRRTHG
jgi:hypothetical protein